MSSDDRQRQRKVEAKLRLCDQLQGYLAELAAAQGPQAAASGEAKAAVDHGGMQVMGKKKGGDDEPDQWAALASPSRKKGKKKKTKKKPEGLQHPMLRMTGFAEVGVDPPNTVAQIAACQAALTAQAERLAAGELEAAASPAVTAAEPEPEPSQEDLADLLAAGPSLPGKADEEEGALDADMSDFLDGIEDGDDDGGKDDFGTGEKKAGEANGAAECRTLSWPTLGCCCPACIRPGSSLTSGCAVPRLRHCRSGPGKGAGDTEGLAQAADG